MRDEAGVPKRTFSDSAPTSSKLEELSETYGHAPERDERTGSVRFQSTFDAELPKELDGDNGWSRMEGAFGTTTLWYEVPAPSSHAWPRLVQRVESGILWLRILKRWAQNRLPEERSALIDEVFEEEFIPQIVDGYLRWVGAGAIMSAQRVGLNIRKEENREELTDDELFRLEVILPILIALASDGPLESEELHMAFLIGIDGAASRNERTRVWDNIGKPVVLRFLRRFEPEREDITLAEIRSWGFSILLFAAQTGRYKDLLLASPAVSEEDKEVVRRGGMIVPPAPFGVRFLGRTTPIQATIDLEPSAQPFLSNGVQVPLANQEEAASASAEELFRFQMSIRPPREGPLFGSPPAYALWSTPNDAWQEAVFGSVALTEADLALIVGWERLLSKKQHQAWMAAVQMAVESRSREPLNVFLREHDGIPPKVLLERLQTTPSEAP